MRRVVVPNPETKPRNAKMSIIDKLFGDNDKPRDTPAKADGPMQKVLDCLLYTSPSPRD